MGYLVPNDLLQEHECPLAVIKCVDFRFRESDQEFVAKGLGYKNFDLYAWPGSAKDVLKNNGFKVSFINSIITVSKNLHQVKKLLLLWHWDCGAYGGSKNFSDAATEEQAYNKDLQTVKEMLAKELPEDLEIIMAYSKAVPQGLDYIVVD
ncbi:MAG: carbonic anhydrase [Patescibacteria group bacterium]